MSERAGDVIELTLSVCILRIMDRRTVTFPLAGPSDKDLPSGYTSKADENSPPRIL